MDDLNTPLGQRLPAPRRFSLATIASRTLAGVLGAAVAGFALWAAVVRDPLGGEPVARVNIATSQSSEAAAATPAPAPASAPEAAPPTNAEKPAGTQTITIIDGSSGKRQEVLIPGTDSKRSNGDPRLLENTRHGLIPRIAPDGAKPVELYARKSSLDIGKATTGPKIAIVVGGLGISASSTADALAKLPPAVTLAFTPYGGDLDTPVARAREKGHEVLLQIPMEPHDYPDNDPGPQTLLTGLSAEQNLDRLHWLFSRMQGYVGISNYMGSRFSASEAALGPVLREVSRRGLLYFDDGTTPRSQAAQISGANKLPFAKADIVIDAVPGPAEIDNALNRLEAAARERGLAVGFSSALPASIDRIARWAKGAQTRGIVLVPVTAAAVKPRSS